MTGAAVLAFLDQDAELDYGRRFSRLHWRRAVGASKCVSLAPADRASERIGGKDIWVIVPDDTVLPLGGPSREPARGRILAARSASLSDLPTVHTLRELEEAAPAVLDVAKSAGRPCALCLRPEEHPAVGDEPIAAYVARLSIARDCHDFDARFAAVVLEDSSARERPELSNRVPAETRRLLDVGCGAGGTSAALKKRFPLLTVTGVEKDAAAAERAGRLLDRVLQGDAAGVLERLAGAGERFDAFLFGDVLEHLEDPVGMLSLARRIAFPGARLVASVPNIGHLSLLRDLLLGRFDPAPAGLSDAGHLRWFDRRFLTEALEEAGWRVLSIEPAPGAPARQATEFYALLSGWPGLDRESLSTYQWIAVAVADNALKV